MTQNSVTTTSAANGRLWGARSQVWAEVQEGVHRPFYDAVFSRTEVSARTRYLDLGCGSGLAAQIATGLGADVTGLDAAQEMIDIAQARVPQGNFHQGELEELPLADGSFDVVTGFNSFQYASNPVAALAEARRVVVKNGWVAAVVWGDPGEMEATDVVSALKPFMPAPPPGAAGPFALSDKDALRKLAEDAGLSPADIFDVECPFEYPDEETAVSGLCSTGVAVKAAENSSDADVEEAYTMVARKYLQPDGSVRILAKFRCLLAHPKT